MSYVYLAREVATGYDVAIKVLSPKLATDRSSVERLRREAGLAMRLDHPNVCRILRLGESEDGLIYLVMPFLKGELLSDREVKGGPMNLAAGINVLRQVCAGLHHAHEVQIVHRDLKPENIMLVAEDNGRERAVVMDFGLAKERRADPAIAKLTATGIILGTPEFMSPEQIRGKPLDARSDIYALGIVAFEMFTGKLPFQGRNAQEMMIARLRGSRSDCASSAPISPEGLEAALARAMKRTPMALQHRARVRRRAHRIPRRWFPVEDQGEAEIRRFPAFDPPEYVEWKPDPALVRGFRETIERDPERAAVVARLPVETKLALYAGLFARAAARHSAQALGAHRRDLQRRGLGPGRRRRPSARCTRSSGGRISSRP